MPCHVELSEAEIEANRRARTEKEIAKVVEPLQKRNDELTHENDQLREALLTIIGYQPKAAIWIGKDVAQKIEKAQVEHRKEDLRRLDKGFTKYLEDAIKTQGLTVALQTQDFNEAFARLKKVMKADPEKPLEEQLGFDPDKY